MSTQFNCQKHFYFKLFKQLYITIQLSVNTVLVSKTVLFQTIQFIQTVMNNNLVSCQYSFNVKNSSILIIQFSISMQFKCKYGLIVKTFLFQAIQFNPTIQFSISMQLVLFNP